MTQSIKIINYLKSSIAILGLGILVFGFIFAPIAQAQTNQPSNQVETNVIASVGFKECDFSTGKGTINRTKLADQSSTGSAFQTCVRSILQFFFVIALFLIALRIGAEAFSSINPLVGGKAIDNSITLVRDVTIGLLLIGAPGIFLSFLNPTALNLNSVLDLNGLRLNSGQSTTNTGGTNTTNNQTKNPTQADPNARVITTVGGQAITAETLDKLIKEPKSEPSKKMAQDILKQVITTGTYPNKELQGLLDLVYENPDKVANELKTIAEATPTKDPTTNKVKNYFLPTPYEVKIKKESPNEFRFILQCQDSASTNKLGGVCQEDFIVSKTDITSNAECSKLDKINVGELYPNGAIGCPIQKVQN